MYFGGVDPFSCSIFQELLELHPHSLAARQFFNGLVVVVMLNHQFFGLLSSFTRLFLFKIAQKSLAEVLGDVFGVSPFGTMV